ncbi:MAG: AMP-binding protein, partial [Caldilineaceae bacterium]|nr:AMP-binding protein [Caldilineaceae bacterium]
MITQWTQLITTPLLTPKGLWRLGQAIAQGGPNLMALLQASAQLHPTRTALVTEEGALTYQELWQQATALAYLLQQEYGIARSTKVALVCRNHRAAVCALFAIARLGASLYLVNPEQSPEQIRGLGRDLGIDHYLYDAPLASTFAEEPLASRATPAPALLTAINTCINATVASHQATPLPCGGSGRVVVLTSGSTGRPKSVARQPSPRNYLAPFWAFLTTIGLGRHPALYVATPLCHGYGLALLLLGVALGRTLLLTER